LPDMTLYDLTKN